MNERIRELAKQAGAEDFYSSGYKKSTPEEADAFAKKRNYNYD